MEQARDQAVRRLAIRADGVTLIADARGDSANPPVVLLHGGGQTRHAWRDTAADLAAVGWYAVTVDLRGHGESGWSPDGQYRLDQLAGDVVRIAEHLGGPPVLVGASLGGNASLAALGDRPGLALALVLVDVSPFVRPDGALRVRKFMAARPDGFASVEEAAETVAAYLPHRPRPNNLHGLRRNLRLVDGRYHWHWDPAFLRAAEDHGAGHDRLTDPARLHDAARSLQVPTLLIRGGNSDVVGPEDARQFLRLVPHAEYGQISGAHHMVAGDDNRQFGALLEDFLKRRVRARLEVLGT